ncbi:MAG: transcription termination factor Rho [Eggerthellaceae bacterium]|nr:transcription termination factor Rho [Eggerthellaceae bacterium]
MAQPAAEQAPAAEGEAVAKPRRTRTRKTASKPAADAEAAASAEASAALAAPADVDAAAALSVEAAAEKAEGEVASKPRRTRTRKKPAAEQPVEEQASAAGAPVVEAADKASATDKASVADKASAEENPEARASATSVASVEAAPEAAAAAEGVAEGVSEAAAPAEKPHKRERRERNRDKRNAQNAQGESRNASQGNQQNGKQGNGQKNNREDRHNRRRERKQNREIVPSVTREELAELKVADLRVKASELGLEAAGLKKAELVDAVYEASMKAEGFIEVSGVLDIMSDGYGFLRASGYLPGEGDAYVGTALIRRNGLRKGDFVVGQTRPARENEKFAAIQKVLSVNGVSVEEIAARPRFADLTPIYPDERLLMEHGRTTITARVIDLCAPIGKGQRGLIVSPPKAGKTTVLKDIAAAITANNPEVHLMCLLVDERPEEVTDMERSIKGEVVSSTFDMPSENHIAVAELVIERAKRLVEMGKDVVILLDSITRLARAYNLAQPASGRILSGGVDSTALYPPKRFLGAARNIEGGGSLTILASALIDTGSKMDEVIFEEFKGTGNMELKLDRYLADRRIFPAIDPVSSGTRKEELLLDPQEAPLIWAVRRILANLNNTERAMDMLIKSLKQTDTNQEFLIRTAKKAQTQHGKSDENFEF